VKPRKLRKIRRECRKITALLVEFVDNELDPERAEMVENHLMVCSSCKQECEDLKTSKELISSLPEHPAPADFLIAVRRRISAEPEVSEGLEKALEPIRGRFRNALPFLTRPPLPQLALAASFVLVFISAFILGRYFFPLHEGVVALSAPSLAESTASPGGETEDASPVAFHESGSEVSGGPELRVPGFEGSARIQPVSTHYTLDSTLLYPYQTPSEFVQALIKNDPQFKNAEIYPLPQGALIHTPLHLYEITISNTAFLRAQRLMLLHGTKLPGSLTQAQTIYHLKISVLPSPLLPLQIQNR
jgi:hypothetical protein